eukprot:UN09255
MHLDILDEIPSCLTAIKMFMDTEVARQGRSLYLENSAREFLQFDNALSDVPLPKKTEPRTT